MTETLEMLDIEWTLGRKNQARLDHRLTEEYGCLVRSQLSNCISTSVFLLCCCVARVASSDTLLEETFDGNGDFKDLTRRVEGFDLPNWAVFIDDQFGGRILDRGYSVNLPGGSDRTESITMLDLPWNTGFVQRVEIRDLQMFVAQDDLMRLSTVSQQHVFPGSKTLGLSIEWP